MSLKTTILDTLSRDDMNPIVNGHGVDGVDRRSVEGMRKKLSRTWDGKVSAATNGMLTGQLVKKENLHRLCVIPREVCSLTDFLRQRSLVRLAKAS